MIKKNKTAKTLKTGDGYRSDIGLHIEISKEQNGLFFEHGKTNCTQIALHIHVRQMSRVTNLNL